MPLGTLDDLFVAPPARVEPEVNSRLLALLQRAYTEVEAHEIAGTQHLIRANGPLNALLDYLNEEIRG